MIPARQEAARNSGNVLFQPGRAARQRSVLLVKSRHVDGAVYERRSRYDDRAILREVEAFAGGRNHTLRVTPASRKVSAR